MRKKIYILLSSILAIIFFFQNVYANGLEIHANLEDDYQVFYTVVKSSYKSRQQYNSSSWTEMKNKDLSPYSYTTTAILLQKDKFTEYSSSNGIAPIDGNGYYTEQNAMVVNYDNYSSDVSDITDANDYTKIDNSKLSAYFSEESYGTALLNKKSYSTSDYVKLTESDGVKMLCRLSNNEDYLITMYKIPTSVFDRQEVKNLMQGDHVYVSFVGGITNHSEMLTAYDFFDIVFGKNVNLQQLMNLASKINQLNIEIAALDTKIAEDNINLENAIEAANNGAPTSDIDKWRKYLNDDIEEQNDKKSQLSNNRATIEAEYEQIRARSPENTDGILWYPYVKGVTFDGKYMRGYSAANDYDNILYIEEKGQELYVQYEVIDFDPETKQYDLEHTRFMKVDTVKVGGNDTELITVSNSKGKVSRQKGNYGNDIYEKYILELGDYKVKVDQTTIEYPSLKNSDITKQYLLIGAVDEKYMEKLEDYLKKLVEDLKNKRPSAFETNLSNTGKPDGTMSFDDVYKMLLQKYASGNLSKNKIDGDELAISNVQENHKEVVRWVYVELPQYLPKLYIQYELVTFDGSKFIAEPTDLYLYQVDTQRGEGVENGLKPQNSVVYTLKDFDENDSNIEFAYSTTNKREDSLLAISDSPLSKKMITVTGSGENGGKVLDTYIRKEKYAKTYNQQLSDQVYQMYEIKPDINYSVNIKKSFNATNPKGKNVSFKLIEYESELLSKSELCEDPKYEKAAEEVLYDAGSYPGDGKEFSNKFNSKISPMKEKYENAYDYLGKPFSSDKNKSYTSLGANGVAEVGDSGYTINLEKFDLGEDVVIRLYYMAIPERDIDVYVQYQLYAPDGSSWNTNTVDLYNDSFIIGNETYTTIDKNDETKIATIEKITKKGATSGEDAAKWIRLTKFRELYSKQIKQGYYQGFNGKIPYKDEFIYRVSAPVSFRAKNESGKTVAFFLVDYLLERNDDHEKYNYQAFMAENAGILDDDINDDPAVKSLTKLLFGSDSAPNLNSKAKLFSKYSYDKTFEGANNKLQGDDNTNKVGWYKSESRRYGYAISYTGNAISGSESGIIDTVYRNYIPVTGEEGNKSYAVAPAIGSGNLEKLDETQNVVKYVYIQLPVADKEINSRELGPFNMQGKLQFVAMGDGKDQTIPEDVTVKDMKANHEYFESTYRENTGTTQIAGGVKENVGYDYIPTDEYITPYMTNIYSYVVRAMSWKVHNDEIKLDLEIHLKRGYEYRLRWCNDKENEGVNPIRDYDEYWKKNYNEKDYLETANISYPTDTTNNIRDEMDKGIKTSGKIDWVNNNILAFYYDAIDVVGYRSGINAGYNSDNQTSVDQIKVINSIESAYSTYLDVNKNKNAKQNEKDNAQNQYNKAANQLDMSLLNNDNAFFLKFWYYASDKTGKYNANGEEFEACDYANFHISENNQSDLGKLKFITTAYPDHEHTYSDCCLGMEMLTAFPEEAIYRYVKGNPSNNESPNKLYPVGGENPTEFRDSKYTFKTDYTCDNIVKEVVTYTAGYTPIYVAAQPHGYEGKDFYASVLLSTGQIYTSKDSEPTIETHPSTSEVAKNYKKQMEEKLAAYLADKTEGSLTWCEEKDRALYNEDMAEYNKKYSEYTKARNAWIASGRHGEGPTAPKTPSWSSHTDTKTKCNCKYNEIERKESDNDDFVNAELNVEESYYYSKGDMGIKNQTIQNFAKFLESVKLFHTNEQSFEENSFGYCKEDAWGQITPNNGSNSITLKGSDSKEYTLYKSDIKNGRYPINEIGGKIKVAKYENVDKYTTYLSNMYSKLASNQALDDSSNDDWKLKEETRYCNFCNLPLKEELDVKVNNAQYVYHNTELLCAQGYPYYQSYEEAIEIPDNASDAEKGYKINISGEEETFLYGNNLEKGDYYSQMKIYTGHTHSEKCYITCSFKNPSSLTSIPNIGTESTAGTSNMIEEKLIINTCDEGESKEKSKDYEFWISRVSGGSTGKSSTQLALFSDYGFGECLSVTKINEDGEFEEELVPFQYNYTLNFVTGIAWSDLVVTTRDITDFNINEKEEEAPSIEIEDGNKIYDNYIKLKGSKDNIIKNDVTESVRKYMGGVTPKYYSIIDFHLYKVAQVVLHDRKRSEQDKGTNGNVTFNFSDSSDPTLIPDDNQYVLTPNKDYDNLFTDPENTLVSPERTLNIYIDGKKKVPGYAGIEITSSENDAAVENTIKDHNLVINFDSLGSNIGEDGNDKYGIAKDLPRDINQTDESFYTFRNYYDRYFRELSNDINGPKKKSSLSLIYINNDQNTKTFKTVNTDRDGNQVGDSANNTVGSPSISLGNYRYAIDYSYEVANSEVPIVMTSEAKNASKSTGSSSAENVFESIDTSWKSRMDSDNYVHSTGIYTGAAGIQNLGNFLKNSNNKIESTANSLNAEKTIKALQAKAVGRYLDSWINYRPTFEEPNVFLADYRGKNNSEVMLAQIEAEQNAKLMVGKTDAEKIEIMQDIINAKSKKINSFEDMVRETVGAMTNTEAMLRIGLKFEFLDYYNDFFKFKKMYGEYGSAGSSVSGDGQTEWAQVFNHHMIYADDGMQTYSLLNKHKNWGDVTYEYTWGGGYTVKAEGTSGKEVVYPTCKTNKEFAANESEKKTLLDYYMFEGYGTDSINHESKNEYNYQLRQSSSTINLDFSAFVAGSKTTKPKVKNIEDKYKNINKLFELNKLFDATNFTSLTDSRKYDMILKEANGNIFEEKNTSDGKQKIYGVDGTYYSKSNSNDQSSSQYVYTKNYEAFANQPANKKLMDIYDWNLKSQKVLREYLGANGEAGIDGTGNGLRDFDFDITYVIVKGENGQENGLYRFNYGLTSKEKDELLATDKDKDVSELDEKDRKVAVSYYTNYVEGSQSYRRQAYEPDTYFAEANFIDFNSGSNSRASIKQSFDTKSPENTGNMLTVLNPLKLSNFEFQTADVVVHQDKNASVYLGKNTQFSITVTSGNSTAGKANYGRIDPDTNKSLGVKTSKFIGEYWIINDFDVRCESCLDHQSGGEHKAGSIIRVKAVNGKGTFNAITLTTYGEYAVGEGQLDTVAFAIANNAPKKLIDYVSNIYRENATDSKSSVGVITNELSNYGNPVGALIQESKDTDKDPIGGITAFGDNNMHNVKINLKSVKISQQNIGQQSTAGEPLYHNTKNDALHITYKEKKSESTYRIFGFEITDFTDLNFKEIFRDNENKFRTSGNYFAGKYEWDYKIASGETSDRNREFGELKSPYQLYKLNDINLMNIANAMIDRTLENNKDKCGGGYVLPVGPYSRGNGYIYAPKLGYTFSFDFKTTGYFPQITNKNRTVKITPSFYYISKSGTNYTDVELYYKDASGIYKRFIGSGYEIKFKPNDGYRKLWTADEEGYKSYLSDEYQAIDISNTKGFELDEKFMTSSFNDFMQTWYGEFKLPNSTIAIAKDENGNVNSNDINSPLLNGYIGVKFNISVYRNGTEVVSYDKQDSGDILNYEGRDNTTQWDYDGTFGNEEKGKKINMSYKLEKGNWQIDNDTWQKVKNTVVLYDTDLRADDDFK